MALDVEDGEGFLRELHRGDLKLWPTAVGTYIEIPQSEDGLRVTIKAGKHSASLEMDGHVSMIVQPEGRLSVQLLLKGRMTDKAATSLWAIQVEGGAYADIETMQAEM